MKAGTSLFWMFLTLGSLLLLFIAVPLIRTVIGVSPPLLWQTALDGEVRTAIWLTLYAAALATVLAMLAGVPLAYLLARHHFPGKQLVEGLVDLPVVVPHTAAGIALLMVFGRRGLLGPALDRLGFRFTGSVAGIVAAMLFVSLPFLVNTSKEAFAAVDPRLERIARTLGASPWEVFWRVTLPLAWQGVLAGAVMMWARGISEFGAVVILAYHPMTAPVLVYERFETYGLRYARPVAVLLILVSLLVFIVLRLVNQRIGERATSNE
ncbi:MAG TPA: ABC transporter permease subunit [Anaerolineae bacterium]|nr:ABC transporter permease subunit [Anaerolineae bacterium]HIQ04697.1 ABC transporter permease subunit [Anaerolineae bacterium]